MSINKEGSSKNSTEVEILVARGVRFTEIKEELGFKTLEDFGAAIVPEGAKPIDKSTLSKMERGVMAISKKIMVELSSKYHVNLDYILYGKTPKFFIENDSKRDKSKAGSNSAPDNPGDELTMIKEMMTLLKEEIANTKLVASANLENATANRISAEGTNRLIIMLEQRGGMERMGKLKQA